MQNCVNFFLLCCMVAALPVPPAAAQAGPDDAGPPQPTEQEQEVSDRWIPSFAISGGANFEKWYGTNESFLYEDMAPDPVPLQPAASGDDIAAAPFVGASLEILTPEIPIPTTPRFFAGAEILPTFSSERNLAVAGEPGCIRGPEAGAPCARDEPPGSRLLPFGNDSINGEGVRTKAEYDLLTYGAYLGVAFPVQAWGRELRFKPSVAWINYKVNASGKVVDGECLPVVNPNGTSGCTDVGARQGFVRETVLTADTSRRFNGIGPALDLEVDTGRFGPLGSSIFLGARAYRVLGDRTMEFGTSETYDDVLGMDTATADFGVEVGAWMLRAHVGFRLHWLGGGD